ncbi:MAG: TIR domain-containing protein [Anaerolineae bacterium]|nr:TIR domain-containing protein [Anaerolineae bacterium]
MPDHDDIRDEFDEFDDDPLEAYCVKCREMVEIEEPQPVWTRKGTPGTRGFCPVCGTTVFRMGKTAAHRGLKQPQAVQVAAGATHSRQRRASTAVAATYVAYADGDAVFAHRLADDLGNMGVATYLPRASNGDVAWAGGVHPALEDCTQLLVVLSPAALTDGAAQAAWSFFRERRKPIVVALLAALDVPDDLRRAARVDFSGDYRPALRELVQVLAG